MKITKKKIKKSLAGVCRKEKIAIFAAPKTTRK
jgi:hypothetical protein